MLQHNKGFGMQSMPYGVLQPSQSQRVSRVALQRPLDDLAGHFFAAELFQAMNQSLG
jgi:hypothetical protein